MSKKNGHSPPKNSNGHGLPKVGAAYLRSLLPAGWQRYFHARPAGKYWGLSIICPVCEAKPPQQVRYGSQRWRWLAAHLTSHKQVSSSSPSQRP
jgi:hypothetical protein